MTSRSSRAQKAPSPFASSKSASFSMDRVLASAIAKWTPSQSQQVRGFGTDTPEGVVCYGTVLRALRLSGIGVKRLRISGTFKNLPTDTDIPLLPSVKKLDLRFDGKGERTQVVNLPLQICHNVTELIVNCDSPRTLYKTGNIYPGIRRLKLSCALSPKDRVKLRKNFPNVTWIRTIRL